MCLGLHTGRVVVDRLGGDPLRLYTAVGETTQMALRLRQLAAPGTTLLSVATQRLVQADVRVEPQGEVMVGAAQVPVYGVRGIAQRRSGVVGHGARARSPFVGRERELALLHERLDAVVAGQGQVVALVGEPGMGKSRLLAEYRRSLGGRRVQYTEGHCLSYGSGTPYLPVVDMVHQLCGVTAGEPSDAITAKVHRRLQAADIALEEGVALVLHLLDIPHESEPLARLRPPERKARTFALLRQLVIHLALDSPLNALAEHGRRLALLDEAEALARALDDRARLGRVLAGRANVLRQTGDPDGAIAAGQQALAIAVEFGESDLQDQASHTLGGSYWAIGNFSRAAELLRRNIEVVSRESSTPRTELQIQSQAWLAMPLSALGAFAEGRRHGEEALRLATLEGRGNAPIVAHACLGLLYLAQGDLENAIRVFALGLALCCASGNRNWSSGIAAGLGYAYAL